MTLVLQECDGSARPGGEGYRLEGHWKSEGLRVEGIGVPIAPDIRIFQDRMVLRSAAGKGSKLPVKGLEVTWREVPVKLGHGGITLVFEFEQADRVSFSIPFAATKLFYTRVRSR